MNCPICETDEHVVDVPVMNYARGCDQCGAIFRRVMPTLEKLEQFYVENYPKIWHKKRDYGTSPSLRSVNRSLRLCHVISQFVEVPPFIERHLDIGCGAGLLLSTVHQSLGGCESIGVELGEFPMVSFIERADEVGLQIYKTLDDVTGTFDLVTLSHFLEHVANPMDWLRRAYTFARDNALIIAEVPNMCGEPTALPAENEAWLERGFPPPHLIGYSQHALSYALTRAGFFVREVQTTLPLECRISEYAPGYVCAIAAKRPMGQVQNTIKRNFSQLSGGLPQKPEDPHPRLAFTPMWNMPGIQDHLRKQLDGIDET